MADGRGSIHEVDSQITILQVFLSMSPRSHPYRALALFGLAFARLQRNKLLSQREDLDKSILHCTELLLFPPSSWPGDGPMVLDVLFFLASALLDRSKVSNRPEDAILAAKYLRHHRDQPCQAFGIQRHEVTTSLVATLALQVKFETGNVEQNIGEMADLYRELLTLDVSDIDTLSNFSFFVEIVRSKIRTFVPLAAQPWDRIIECLRAARVLKPERHEARLALFECIFNRYVMTLANDAYEEASSIMDEFATSNPPGEFQDKARFLMSCLAMIRSHSHENPEYSEEAIYRHRAFLASSTSSFNEDRLKFSVEITAKKRFDYFGSIEGLERGLEGSSTGTDSRLLELESQDILELTLSLKALELLEGLLSGIRNNDITNIDEAIEKGRTILASASVDLLTSTRFHCFGEILTEAFERTKKIEYLNESISTLRQALECPYAHRVNNTRRSLFLALISRCMSLPDHPMQDLNEAMEQLSLSVHDVNSSLPLRFQAAFLWAGGARALKHSSVSKAYEGAMSLIQDILLFAPTLHLQHAALTTPGDLAGDSNKMALDRMALDNASYQVDLGQLEEAIVTLEKGRALLWSEMRHLRAPIDQLLQVDPQLGDKFAAVNRDLEELTKSIPPSHNLSMDDGTADDLRAVDPFGRLLLKQRNLLKERDGLISQIRVLPSFNSFLTPPSFDTLRSAASAGPVILINHSCWRSDILILLHNSSPSLITTPDDFYDRASALKDELLASRHKYGLDSSHYDETLASILAELYELVGKRVIDRLLKLNVPEQSRIWWCPTSVFCSLPLHAMGPVPSDDGEIRYFLDLFVCSYTPTLSALVQSRNRDFGSRPLDRPSLLLVAPPDPSLPTVGGEIQVVQALDTTVTSFISEDAIPATVIDGFRHHQFVHFACHGTLKDGNPFEAGFELYGDERLTLLEIVRAHLPTAEFAFLSACHTAEVTEGSVADEGLHLAAAVQYCGFRSVVGTMWAMVDEDGRDLAKHFYKALFSTSRREEGIPYHERSAKALRFAVKKLRAKRRISLERWVNFVHYGA